MAGGLVLALLVTSQTLAHLDEHGGFLYMTRPGFPVGVGTGADGYVFWLEGHATYAEAWQFAQQSGIYAGASTDLATGLTDARAAYSYLAALLARPFGYFGGSVALNILCWLAASLATWYLARTLLGREAPAYAAALLTAAGQGFVFVAGTPMSYVAGYAWAALLLAAAMRWQLFGWQSSGRRWLAWGLLCGVAGLFYFTHVVLLGAAWAFGARRVRLRNLVGATCAALALPATWYLFGHSVVGLHFENNTAQDLAGAVSYLAQIALHRPLLVPSEAGDHSVRALVGSFYYVTLSFAILGVLLAPPRRQQWYLAVAICGLGPAFLLHYLPVTQRFGYLSYPAVYIAAVEGAWRVSAFPNWLWKAMNRPMPVRRVPDRRAAIWGGAALALLIGAQLVQANSDLVGVYRFALAFGAP